MNVLEEKFEELQRRAHDNEESNERVSDLTAFAAKATMDEILFKYLKKVSLNIFRSRKYASLTCLWSNLVATKYLI